MKWMVMLAMVALGLRVCAATYTFPSTGEDIAKDWGDGNRPGSSDVALFTSPKTLISSEDVTFGQIQITPTVQNKTFVFDLRNSGKTVTLMQDGTTPSFQFGLRSTTVWLKGGVWDSVGSGYFTAGGKSSCAVILTNGVDLTVAGTLVAGYAQASGDKLIVTGGSMVKANSVNVAINTNTGSTLEVRNGSKVQTTDMVCTENQKNCYNSTICVSGTGSSFSVPSGKNVQIGYCSYGGKLIVEDGASFSCGSLYVGSFLNSNVAHDNFVYADDASITTEQELYVGRRGSGNVAEFTNTVVTVKGSFRIGSEMSSSNNTVRFIGPKATLSYVSDSMTPLFFNGSYNELSFEDGASHELSSSDVILSGLSHHNRILLKNGGALRKTGGKTYLSARDPDLFATSYANTIEIESCATNQFYDMYIGSTDNRIVVSNGVILSERKDPNGYSLRFGAKDGDGADPARNALVLKGASPRVEIADSGINLDHASLLRFEIPAAGYAEAPVQVRKLTLSEDSVLEVDCAALVANPQEKTQRICLANCTGTNGLLIPDSVLAAANAGLPERCSLYTEDGKLMLKIPGTGGLILIFR